MRLTNSIAVLYFTFVPDFSNALQQLWSWERYHLYVKEKLWTCFIFIIYVTYSNEFEFTEDLTKKNSHLEVRAVMVMCDMNVNSKNYLDGETARFQREELFKHSALEDCKQKLALTVKISNDPKIFYGDEYIPIEHVLGADQKRIRLFNPYVLRLRRKSPFQAYKLRKIEIVTGIILNSPEDLQVNSKTFENRIQRDLLFKSSTNDSYTNDSLMSRSVTSEGTKISQDIPFPLYDDDNYSIDIRHNYVMPLYDHQKENNVYSSNAEKEFKAEGKKAKQQRGFDENPVITSGSRWRSEEKNILDYNMNVVDTIKNKEKKYVLYEITDPELVCGAHLQLFEKLITPQGKTLWKDLMKDDMARVSLKNNKWKNQDVNIQYKPEEYLAREDYRLPLKSLRLIVPIKDGGDASQKDRLRDFIIVPMDDIITLNDFPEDNKRNCNESKGLSNNSSYKQNYRRVGVRVTRALMTDHSVLRIFSQASEKYLKVPHTKPHNAHIDIEARADDNELILLGAFGRLMTIVSDSSRATRAILTIQASNMGLAACNFKAIVRECSPSALGVENLATDPILIPPRHTRSYHINIPFQEPTDVAHCTAALVNDDDETIAVRDVKIKKGDRCFCVWYCDCVCLSEDPKLLCQPLPDAHLVAAGLPIQARTRYVRSICYPDVVIINVFVAVLGVLLALLFLGIIKAFVGLILQCVGSWGLYFILQTPRKLERYYESSLRSRRVVYDKEGWPIHPDSKQRDVRLISKSMEFILNIIFFIILPCVIIWEAIRKLSMRCVPLEHKSGTKYRNEHKKCFSSHDTQGFEPLHRKHGSLRQWMTPQAEELSTKILHKGLAPDGYTTPQFQENLDCGKINNQRAFMDSEQDDTDYVLMQIQKSKEKLAKSQAKIESTVGSGRKDGQNENKIH